MTTEKHTAVDEKALIDAAAKVSTMPAFSHIESPLIFAICTAYEAAKQQPTTDTQQAYAITEREMKLVQHYRELHKKGDVVMMTAMELFEKYTPKTTTAQPNTQQAQPDKAEVARVKAFSGGYGYEISGNTIYIGRMRACGRKVADITCTIGWDETYTDESKQRRLHDAERICAALPQRNLVEELVEALELTLPLAKGYAAAHRVGSNSRYVEIAESILAKAAQAKKGEPFCNVCGNIKKLTLSAGEFIEVCDVCTKNACYTTAKKGE